MRRSRSSSWLTCSRFSAVGCEPESVGAAGGKLERLHGPYRSHHPEPVQPRVKTRIARLRSVMVDERGKKHWGWHQRSPRFYRFPEADHSRRTS